MKASPKQSESVPEWARDVKPLNEPLMLPDSEGNCPRSADENDIDPNLLKKNILSYTLHVLFI